MTGPTGRAGMSVILFIVGILLAATGIVAIGFGIPINEFNLGNTLIVAGTIAISAGLIIIGLAAAVDQLTQIVQALRPRAGARPALQPQTAEPAAPIGVRLGQAPDQGAVPVPPKAPMPAPRPPVFAQARAEDRGLEPTPAEPAPEASFSAIERLRSTLGRPERKAGEAADSGDAEQAPYAPPASAAPAGPGFGTAAGANGSAPPAGTGAADARKKPPPLDFLFRSKSREPQPEAFDSVWPKRGSRRQSEQADAGESAKPAAAPAPIDRPHSDPPLASPSDDSRPPAILKSGVVDGMAYTLYADGSIEAQLPQGTVRFGSIAELRSHIENNS
jgi:hypothetical protein